MRRFLLFTFIAASAFLLTSSCKRNILHGEGEKHSISVNTPRFTGIDINMPFRTIVNVREGSLYSVEFSGYQNIIKHLKPVIDRTGNLTVTTDLDETWEIDCKGLVLTVNLPLLQDVSLTGSSNAQIHGDVKGDRFRLVTSGASEVVIDKISTGSFFSEISGAGKLEVLAGSVRKATYEVSGAAKILAFGLQTNETVASVSGAAKGEISASEKLTADISGAGSIKYKGHPAVIKDISGAGSVLEAN